MSFSLKANFLTEGLLFLVQHNQNPTYNIVTLVHALTLSGWFQKQ